jgi:hypothetical protein
MGDWITSAVHGIANQIISISSQSATSLTCIVEDVDRYNTFCDPYGQGIGIGPVGSGFCFQLASDGLPIIGPIKAGVLPLEFQTDLISRFRHRNIYKDYYHVNQAGHSFQVGDPIYLKTDGTYALATSTIPAAARVIGTVHEVHTHSASHAADWFAYRPVGPVIQDISPVLPGTPGDVIYAGPTGLTATAPVTNKKAVYIQLETSNKGILINNGNDASNGLNITATIIPSSVSPLLLGTVATGTHINTVTVEVTTAFNGSGAVLSIGPDSNHILLMKEIHNDLSAVGSYQITPSYQVSNNLDIKIFFDLKSSTTGSATISIS